VKLVTNNDEELLQTIHFIGNFPNREVCFLKALEISYRTGLATKEIALAYGYYQFFTINRMVRGTDLDEININPILEAYNRAIGLDPNYWLAKMCKALLFLKLPPKNWIEIEMANIIGIMTEQQKKHPVTEAYFIIPYLIYSDFCFTLGNSKQALEVLVDGKMNAALQPMPFRFLNEFFGLLFKDYFNRLTFSKEKEISVPLRELGQIFFPNEKVFRQPISAYQFVS
jgi:hypothetical protein